MQPRTVIDIGTEIRTPGRRAPAVACLLVAAIAVSGCTSSRGKASHNSIGHKPSHTSTGQTPPGTGVATGGSKAAATEITTSYLRFFDSTLAEAERLPLLQQGEAFSQAIAEQTRGEFAKAASVHVTRVSVTSADQATVIYTLLLDGSPSLPNQTGYAVRENGNWKVAGVTFCRLLGEQGAPPPVCQSAPATALPG